jgi:N-acetylmuramoyl-L-alanine amidase
MSTIIERFLLPLFFVMSILYVFNSFGYESIELKKIFHHTTDDTGYVEKGNVSLYFSHDPEIKDIKKTVNNGEMIEQSFFFPSAVISTQECELMTQRINDYNGAYQVKIEKNQKPVKGITLIFKFPSDKIVLSYDLFDSIGLQKGIVFHLYNKDLLGQLQLKNNQPLLRTLWHQGKPSIAIDPGHGGIDSGAIGYGGIKEKDVCLAIGMTVAHLLEQQGCSVVLTRNSDTNVFLDQRTLCANKNHVDLLVSIHANYAFNTQAMGIETFCIRPNLFKELSSYLSDTEKNNAFALMGHKNDSSYKCAQAIQGHLCRSVERSGVGVIDRKVKFSVTQLLLGAQMPSVLVEVGFLSNEKESELLKSVPYQKVLAQGIVDGIMSVFHS